MDRVKKRRNEYWENYSELKGKRLLNIKEEDVVNKFRSELWEKIILKKEIEKKRQNLNKEIANIEKEIEFWGSSHKKLEEEKLNINKEIAEFEKIEESFNKQFDDLGGEDFDWPSTCDDNGNQILINWLENAFFPDESGWSAVTRQDMKDFRREMKKPLPIGSGICYVLSVPENVNWSKIGFTTKSAQERAEDYSKRHDLELNVAGIIADDNAAALEKILHEEFSSKRVKHGSAKEIFAVPPKECIKKIKSYKREISEEMQNRQLLLIAMELLKIGAKINKNKYNIVSIDEKLDEIVLKQRRNIREKFELKKFKISLSSRERWYRLFGWKARLRRYTELFIYIFLGVILLSVIFSLSYYLIGKVTILLALAIIIMILRYR